MRASFMEEVMGTQGAEAEFELWGNMASLGLTV